MKRALKILFVIGLAVTAVAVITTVLAMLNGLPGGGASFTIDGDTIDFDGLGGFEALMAGMGILIAGVVVLIVVPLALLLGLGIPALLAGLVLMVGLLAAGAVLALVFSPLLAIVMGVWWLLRRGRKPAPALPSASATIQG